jgi:TonB family protein
MNGEWLDVLGRAWTQVGLHLWQASWFLALAALLALALRRAPARAVHAVWWIAMAKLLVPAALLAPLVPVAWFDADPRRAGVFVEQVVVWWGQPQWAADSGATGFAGWWPLLLTIAWVAGAVWLFRLMRRGRPRRPDRGVALERAAGDLLPRVVAALDGTRIPLGAIRVAGSSMVPCVHGLLRPRILLSAALIRALDSEELRAVLLHEDAHRRRRDPLLAAVQRVALAFFFFYPPLWWLVRRLRETAEQACDDSVVARGVDPACYARALARVVRLELNPVGAPAVLGLGAPSQLARRLERVRDSRRYVMQQRHRLYVAAAVAALVVVSFLPAVSGGNEAEPQDVVQAVTSLDGIAGIDAPLAFSGEGIDLATVLDAFRTATGFDVRVDEGLDDPATLRATLPASTLRVALLEMASRNRLTYRVEANTLTVLPQPRIAGTSGVSSPKLVLETKVEPVYPEVARAAGVEGVVMLQAVIRADGKVAETVVLREEPRDHGFGESAREAVAQWRYEPAQYKGRPVDVYFTVVVKYALSDKDEKPEGPTL